MKYTFESILVECEKRKCQLRWTEQDFKTYYKGIKTNIEITSSCGHNTTVQFNNFIYTNTGVVCKECHYSKFSKQMKNNTDRDYHIQEFQVVKGLQEFLSETIDIRKTNEGCLADFIIRPKGSHDDDWLPIQLKTTTSSAHEMFSFKIHNDYSGMYVMLFYISKENKHRIWTIKGQDIKTKKITIRLKHSTYEKYEVSIGNLSKHLLHLYQTSGDYHNKAELFNKPISKCAQQEHDFRKLRELLFPGFTYTYPEYDSCVCDLIINNSHKVQDKVITVYTKKKKNSDQPRNTSSYCVRLCRSGGPYQKGDNDFYWLFLPDKKGAYILPEHVLFMPELKGKDMISIYPYGSVNDAKYAWLNSYLYFFDKQADIETIQGIFQANGTIVSVCNYDPINIVEFELIKKTPKISKVSKKVTAKHDDFDMKTFVSDIVSRVISNWKICTMCEKTIPKRNKQGFCRQCTPAGRYNQQCQRKVERPPYDQLIAEIEATNYTQVGIKYGVSDNSVRKWVKMYQKYEV
jgi:hypothetical protein